MLKSENKSILSRVARGRQGQIFIILEVSCYVHSLTISFFMWYLQQKQAH